ncbi:MAG: hypothetical protein HC819_01350 [Cyclobacteriaceae bacterium]|nr:hypothetical protein [Cyclobacteriaceae bacterium]
MTNNEFEVLDELYFLQSYTYLAKTLELDDHKLKTTLRQLLEKKWVKCFASPMEELDFEPGKFENDFWNYYYLASKEGLLAHNGNA